MSNTEGSNPEGSTAPYQLQAHCLPVTALHTIVLADSRFILSAQGSYLHVHREDGSEVSRFPIFASQTIHGLLSVDVAGVSYNGQHSVRLFLWGGQEICCSWVTYDESSRAVDLLQSSFSPVASWILKAATSINPGSDCIDLVALTAQNDIEIISCDQQLHGPLALQRRAKVDGPRSFLYSGDVQVVNTDTILVAAGSVFGEVLVWTATRSSSTTEWSTHLRRVLSGHSGSIFGSCLSPQPHSSGAKKYLATCSDDRTVRMWHITKCLSTETSCPNVAVPNKATGFSDAASTEGQQLALAWGHLSRIWDVTFLRSEHTDPRNRFFLATRGEDGTCQIWVFDTDLVGGGDGSNTKNPALRSVEVDRLHAGKNIWSWTTLEAPNKTVIVTGGADGRITSRSILKYLQESERRTFKHDLPFSVLLQNLKSELASGDDISKGLNLPKTFKQYAFLARDLLVASTDSGTLLLVSLTRVAEVHWSVLNTGSLGPNTIICGAPTFGMVFACSPDGMFVVVSVDGASVKTSSCQIDMAVAWMQVANVEKDVLSQAVSSCVVVNSLGLTETKILWTSLRGSALSIETSPIALPSTFVVTASCYCSERQILLLGSRAGALAVYNKVNSARKELKLSACHRHIHGSDSVTSITIVPKDRVSDNADTCGDFYVLTTGRDGTFAIHHIQNISPGIKDVRFATVHRSTPPFGPNIEGAYWTKKPDSTPELILYGFRSTEFVAWSDAQQQFVFNVECGGAHRSWAYNGAITESYEDMGCFVWTKASVFHMQDMRKPRTKLLTTGGHGREIKALAVKHFGKQSSRTMKCGNHLIATGAEDTEIRLFYLQDSEQNDSRHVFSPLTIVRGHNTGPQHLEFSFCGKFLISSGGCEELCIWELTYDIPVMGIGVVLQGKLPSSDKDADTRILSFDVCDRFEETMPAFTLLIAYSDGTARLLAYDPILMSRQEPFELISTLEHGAFCLTQARILKYKDEANHVLLTAGTNGYLNVWCRKAGTIRMDLHQVHQNSITALNASEVGGGQYFIVTGGDDNALGLTLVSITVIPTTAFRSLIVPNAHAAAITAVDVVDEMIFEDPLIIVTAGNDQKVKVWRTTGKLHQREVESETMDEIGLSKVCEAWTNVADISSLKVLKREGISSGPVLEVLVVGVGMEVLELYLSCEYEE